MCFGGEESDNLRVCSRSQLGKRPVNILSKHHSLVPYESHQVSIEGGGVGYLKHPYPIEQLLLQGKN